MAPARFRAFLHIWFTQKSEKTAPRHIDPPPGRPSPTALLWFRVLLFPPFSVSLCATAPLSSESRCISLQACLHTYFFLPGLCTSHHHHRHNTHRDRLLQMPQHYVPIFLTHKSVSSANRSGPSCQGKTSKQALQHRSKPPPSRRARVARHFRGPGPCGPCGRWCRSCRRWRTAWTPVPCASPFRTSPARRALL
jgi:hypothetical protein